MKRRCALVALLLVMGLLFAGCGKSQIAGTWNAELDFTDMFVEEVGDLDVDTKMVMPVVLELTEDGNMSLGLNETAFEANMQSFYDAIINAALKMIYDEMENQGLSREEVDAQAEQTLGMSYEDYLKASMPMEDLMNEIKFETQTGTYKIEEEGTLVAKSNNGDETWTYTLEGDTLTITAIEPNGEDMSSFLPIVFTRK